MGNEKVVSEAEQEWAINCGVQWVSEFLRKKRLAGELKGTIAHWQLLDLLQEAYVIGWIDAKHDGELMRGSA